MLEKKKTKTKKRSMIIMLLLAMSIIVGASTAYAMTKTDQGTTPRGWSFKFVGSYESSTGAASGSTKASFSKHEGCYVKLQIYVLNGRDYINRTLYKENFYEDSTNAGKNNKDIRVYHYAYSREGTNGAGGHTIY